MTVATFFSVKGAPGVTTLACLVGATWPDHRRVAVVEADPFGGDLAARFRLPVALGWASYATAARRSGEPVPLDPHLQALPGGLDVMIGARDGPTTGAEQAVEGLLESCVSSQPAPRDLVVDGGRLLPDDAQRGAPIWLEHSDHVVVVVRRDPASILKVRDRAQALVDRCGDHVGLVVVGSGRHHNAAIEEFTGLPVLGEVPFDPEAAHVASGEGGRPRHLSRSLLVMSARRLAITLAGTDDQHDGDAPEEQDGVRPVPRAPVTRVAQRMRLRGPRRRRPWREDRPGARRDGATEAATEDPTGDPSEDTAAARLSAAEPEERSERNVARLYAAEPEERSEQNDLQYGTDSHEETSSTRAHQGAAL